MTIWIFQPCLYDEPRAFRSQESARFAFMTWLLNYIGNDDVDAWRDGEGHTFAECVENMSTYTDRTIEVQGATLE